MARDDEPETIGPNEDHAPVIHDEAERKYIGEVMGQYDRATDTWACVECGAFHGPNEPHDFENIR